MSVNVEKIIREYIDKTVHMSLGTSRGERPWVCEVHFVYDDMLNLYFRSLESRRHSQDIAANPHVAGNVVRQHAVDEYPHAIYFEGTAAMIADDGERQKLFPLFQSRLKASDVILDEAKSPDGHQFYKITVDNWYAFGKFDGEKGSKYQLSWNGGKQ